MASYTNRKKIKEEKTYYFGTNPEWVVGEYEERVIAKDEEGYYFTTREYVENSLLDPYRMNKKRREEVPQAVLDKLDISEKIEEDE